MSVVIPYHQAAEYLPTALRSVSEQSARPAQVVLVVDGGERPDPALLADCPIAVDVVELPENRGPGPARNAGVAAATQPYVAFLDADDMWAPEKLRRQYDFMHAWPELDGTHTEVVFVFKDGRELQREAGPRALDVVTALSNHVMMTPSIMMRRSSFDAIGGFDPRFRCTQDWEMQIRMAVAGFRIQYLPEVLVRVRREDHGNHSADWRCYLAGHLGIVWKHRREYLARGGYRHWVRRITYECWRAGHKCGGLLGACLRAPYRLGV